MHLDRSGENAIAKRLLCIFASFALAIALIPQAAFAAASDADETEEPFAAQSQTYENEAVDTTDAIELAAVDQAAAEQDAATDTDANDEPAREVLAVDQGLQIICMTVPLQSDGAATPVNDEESQAFQSAPEEGFFQASDSITVETSSIPTEGEELYDNYVEPLFYGNYSFSTFNNIGEAAYPEGTAMGSIYRYLKGQVQKIASGDIDKDANGVAMTYFTLPEEIQNMNIMFTLEDLAEKGYNFTTGDVFTGDPYTSLFTQDFMNAVNAGIFRDGALDNLSNALKVDCPYDLYWSNSAVLGSMLGVGYYGRSEGVDYYLIRVSGIGVQVLPSHRPTVAEYQEDNFASGEKWKATVYFDTKNVDAAATAKAVADAIVEAHKDDSDIAKLEAYRDEICALTDYDWGATFSTASELHQMINVFDNDPSTLSVCEGYAKAFQYLCEATTFKDESIKSYIVRGYAYDPDKAGAFDDSTNPKSNYAHMWNIVTVGGRNYICDVTNYDTNHEKLFLAGCTGEVPSGAEGSGAENCFKDIVCVLYDKEGKVDSGKFYYEYRDATVELYGSSDSSVLAIADESYSPDIDDPIRVVTQPETQLITYGDEATLTFVAKAADASKAVDYQWFRGNSRIRGACESTYVVPFEKVPVGSNYDNYFKCVAALESGETVTSNVVYITVAYKKPLEVYGDGSVEKEYDGTVAPPDSLVAFLDGIVGEDAVEVDSSTSDMFTYASSNVSDNVALTLFEHATLTGKDAGNYEIANPGYSIMGKITPATLRKGNVSLRETELTYTGSELKPNVDVTYIVAGVQTDLVEGVDYTVTYSDNIAIGTEAKVTVSGMGNFQGDVVKTFAIAGLSIEAASINVQGGPFVYDGSAYTPLVDVSLGGSTLTLGTDYTIKSYEDNIYAGDATVTIEGTGAYVGTVSEKFSIEKRPVTIKANDATKAFGDDDPASIGWTVTSGSIVTGDESAITVSLSREEGESVGSYEITPSVKLTTSDYNFSLDKGTFTITPCDISKASIYPVDDMTYDGTPKDPEVLMVYKDEDLIEGTDFTISLSDSKGNAGSDCDNINVGKIDVTIAGKNNFSGSISTSYNIVAADIGGAEVDIPAQEYTGSPITPVPTVTFNGMPLVADTDFTVTYSNNVSIGYATAVLTGAGNFTGTKECNFQIAKESISKADISLNIPVGGYVYDGTAHEPTVVITNMLVKEGTDYTVHYSNNVNAGTATVRVLGCENYMGKKDITFQIAKRDITVSVDDKTKAYGQSDPELTWDASVVPSTATPPAVSLSRAPGEDVGNYSITAIAESSGNYNVIATPGELQITPASIKNATISTIPSQEHTGSAIEPKPTVHYTVLGKETLLVLGDDYEIDYANNVNAGTATATIKGKNNFGDTIDKTFLIAVLSLQKATVTLDPGPFVYNGSAQTPTVQVVLEGSTLTAGSDYEARFTNNVNAGEATVTIEPKSPYRDNVVRTFTIEKATLDNSMLTVPLDKTYTGKDLTPEVSLKLGEMVLAKGTDYTVELTDSNGATGSLCNTTDVGAINIEVIGTGNFKGSLSATYNILQADIADAAAEISDQVFTGSAIEPKPRVTFGGITLVEGTDYTLSYADNIQIGTATATITGTRNFQGTKDCAFKIVQASLAGVKMEVLTPAAGYFYDGTPHEPGVLVNDGALVEGTDFKVTYTNNVDAGTAVVRIDSLNANIGGFKEETFTINKFHLVIDVKDAAKVFGDADPVFDWDVTSVTSGMVAPEVAAVREKGEDAGEYKIDAIVTNDANYSYTSNPGKLTISPADIGGGQITDIPAQDYTGKEVRPNKLYVSLGEIKLVEGEDFDAAFADNINVGEASVTITGKGNYTGTLSSSFRIVVFNKVTVPVFVVSEDIPDRDLFDATLAIEEESLEGEVVLEVDNASDENVANAISDQVAEGNTLLGCYEITLKKDGTELHDSFGTLTVTIPLEEKYNDTNITVRHAHANDPDDIEEHGTYQASDGSVTISNIYDLSIFGLETDYKTPDPVIDNPDPVYYTITTNAGTVKHGTINPSSATVQVQAHGTQKFTFTPESSDYFVSSLYVDGKSVTPATSYTFTNVMSDHELHVAFASKTPDPDDDDDSPSEYPYSWWLNYTGNDGNVGSANSSGGSSDPNSVAASSLGQSPSSTTSTGSDLAKTGDGTDMPPYMLFGALAMLLVLVSGIRLRQDARK